jgi:hypothetical protein
MEIMQQTTTAPRQREEIRRNAMTLPPDKITFRIDSQSHLFLPELLDYMERRRGRERFVVVREWRRRVLAKHCDVGAGEYVFVRSGG